MTKNPKLFFSCVDSRIQENGSLYSRFHLGPFFRGQALTFSNALRRTLLSEIPGIVIKNVQIDGATHEFAVLPGVQETVLDIVLNLKKLVFIPAFQKSEVSDTGDSKLQQFTKSAYLNFQGPGTITALNLKLPAQIKCVDPTVKIATVTGGTNFSLRFALEFEDFENSIKKNVSNFLNSEKTKSLTFDTKPMPVQNVNYVIKSLSAKNESEYVVLEVWTDGSIIPQDAVEFALKKLTNLFFQFAIMSKTNHLANFE